MDEIEDNLRLKNHEEYYKLVDKIRDVTLDAISDALSLEDIISALDRVKVEFIQHQVITEMEQLEDNSEEEGGDELGIDGIPEHMDIKTGMGFVNPVELAEEMRRSIINN